MEALGILLLIPISGVVDLHVNVPAHVDVLSVRALHQEERRQHAPSSPRGEVEWGEGRPPPATVESQHGLDRAPRFGGLGAARLSGDIINNET